MMFKVKCTESLKCSGIIEAKNKKEALWKFSFIESGCPNATRENTKITRLSENVNY